jgi:hypothetical protein
MYNIMAQRQSVINRSMDKWAKYRTREVIATWFRSTHTAASEERISNDMVSQDGSNSHVE